MKLNGSDLTGLLMSVASIFLSFFLGLIATESIGLSIGIMAITTFAIGGAYFSTIGYVERVIVPSIKSD